MVAAVCPSYRRPSLALLAFVASASTIVPSSSYAFSSTGGGGPPAWSDLERKLPSSLVSGPAVLDVSAGDAVPDGDATLAGKTVLYRDKNGWCPRCEQAWLALEVKGIEYVTVLVDGNDEEEHVVEGEGEEGKKYYDRPGSTLPRVQWPDGTVHVGADDMLSLLEKCEEVNPGYPSPPFFPDISVSVDIVRMSIERRFDGVMPRYTLPSSTAPYVYRADKDAEEGEIVQRFKYQVTLEEIEEILEEYDDGPFIAGDAITAADVFWAPYLERFASLLPVLHDGIQPRSLQYEAIKEWYDAMDALPCYSCKVKGRGDTWRRVLKTYHPNLDTHDAADAPIDLPKKRSFKPDKIWSEYAEGKPYLASSPALEVAAKIVRDRDVILRAASEACASLSVEDGTADAALRELCGAIVAADGGDDADALAAAASRLSGDAREVASFLDDGAFWEVPRDIGLIPAEALRAVVNAAPKPRIA